MVMCEEYEADKWADYDLALEANLESNLAAESFWEDEEVKMNKMLKEADAALKARRASTRLIDMSDDDNSLDSRYQ